MTLPFFVVPKHWLRNSSEPASRHFPPEECFHVSPK